LIQALRSTDEAPRRRPGRRRATLMPATVAAIAARAVRLADGEAVALNEVAEVTIMTHPVLEPRRYDGLPALMLRVTPRSTAKAAAVAERVHAHLGWLRANGLMQNGVEIHPLLDEARATQEWLKEFFGLVSCGIASTLLALGLFFGTRAGVAALCTLAIWLVVSAALLWGGGVHAQCHDGRWMDVGLRAVGLDDDARVPGDRHGDHGRVVMALPWVAGATLRPYTQTAMVFAMVTLPGAVIGWLMTAWFNATDVALAPLARFLPPPWRIRLAVSMTAGLVLAAVIPSVAELSQNDDLDATLVIRLRGEDAEKLSAFADDVVSRLRATPGFKNIGTSSVAEERLRLQLDPSRMEDLVWAWRKSARVCNAREGLVVGEVADPDSRFAAALATGNRRRRSGIRTVVVARRG